MDGQPSEEECMESIRKPARWLLVMVVLALFAAACGDGGGTTDEGSEAAGGSEASEAGDSGSEAAGARVEGGTVVFGADQEPGILNSMLADGNAFANGLIVTAILSPLWLITPEFEYEPLLLDGEPEVTEDPFTVTYKLKDEATWSDGTPITADDIIFTQETVMNEKWTITDRSGHDQVEKTEKVDEKTAKFTFKQPYAPWRTLFSTSSTTILPKHILDGKNFNKVWNDEITASSGPFEFDSWEKGQQITLKRNENWWGGKAALDEVVLKFYPDSNTQVQALEADEVDMFYPQPQLDLVKQVAEIEGVTSEASAGPIWEHIDFQTQTPPLDKVYVRQAIGKAINRDEIVEQFIKPLYDGAEPLNNIIFMPNQEQYQDNWSETLAYDPAAAEKLLTDNGCTKEGDVYSCDGEKLEFEYATTTGNELRELQFEVIQQQLAQIGIKVNAAFDEAAVVFADKFLSSKDAWDIFNFAWVGSPDPVGGNPSWMCDSPPTLNNTKYCNEEVSKLLEETDTTVDPAKRAEVWNEADALIAKDVPTVPLYQKPTYFAWDEKIVGPKDNATQVGPFWNIGEWYMTE
jgi:peptide/nickel transport system substrate-binding protein